MSWKRKKPSGKASCCLTLYKLDPCHLCACIPGRLSGAEAKNRMEHDMREQIHQVQKGWYRDIEAHIITVHAYYNRASKSCFPQNVHLRLKPRRGNWRSTSKSYSPMRRHGFERFDVVIDKE